MRLAERRWHWVAVLIAGIVFVAVFQGGTLGHSQDTDNGGDSTTGDIPGWDFTAVRLVHGDAVRAGVRVDDVGVQQAAEVGPGVSGDEQGDAGGEPAASAAPEPPAFTPATDIEQWICTYNWDCRTALRVLYCESGADPNAIGRGSNYGLYQINAVHASHWAGFWEHWFEPAWNIALAYEIWTVRGWSPWACY